MTDRVKFLVSWVHASGSPQGQTQKTIEDATRLYEHLIAQDHRYVEVRVIGGIAEAKGKKMIWHNPEAVAQ